MTSELDFQKHLNRNLADWQTRLVFADWLQDRGDPRAEGYRALGNLRRVPRHFGGLSWGWFEEDWVDREWDLLPTATGPTIPAWLPWQWAWLPLKGPARINVKPAYRFDTDMHARRCRGKLIGEPFRFRENAEDAAAMAFQKLPPELRHQFATGPIPANLLLPDGVT